MNSTERRRLSRRARFGEPRNGWGQLYNPYNTHYLKRYGHFKHRLCANCKQLVNYGQTWDLREHKYYLTRGNRFQCPKCRTWQTIPLLPTIKTSSFHRNSGGKRQTKPMRIYG